MADPALNQQDLINQQFSTAQGNIKRQKQQAEDTLNMGLARQQATGGLMGGAVTKAQQIGENALTNTTQQNQAALDTQKAQALQGVAAQQNQQEFQKGLLTQQENYGTQERLGGQEFQAGQSELTRNQQQEQFTKAFGLQQAQFNESSRQFDQQLQYQLKEFNENQITNFVNALTAFNTAGLGDPDTFSKLAAAVNRVRGMSSLQGG